MLEGLAAGIKGSLGGHLSYMDQAAMMGSSLTNPERLLGTLAGSVYASWESATGSSDKTAFTERWRTEKFFPHFRLSSHSLKVLARWKRKSLTNNTASTVRNHCWQQS